MKDIIGADKSDVAYGAWKDGGRGTKEGFPLGKAGKSTLRYGANYRVRALTFNSNGIPYRVYIAVNFRKLDFCAHLGEAVGSDTRTLASYEFHATHGGWHVHAACGDVSIVPVGRYKGDWKKSLPRDYNLCRRTEWDLVTEQDALRRACEVFGIPIEEDRQGQLL